MMENLHDFQFFTLETLIIQTVILFVILWVLNRFVFQPYLRYLDTEAERREKLEKDYNNIDKLNKEALEEKEMILENARKDAEKMKKDATDIAKKEAQSITQKAMEEAESMKLSAQAEVKKEKETMMRDVRKKSVDLVLQLNAKLFSKETVSRDFIEGQMSSIK